MIDAPTVTQSADQFTAVIRLTIPRHEIRTVMRPALTELMSTLAAQGLKPAGPWFNHHLAMDPETFDFEVSVPVTAPVVAAGRVRPGRLPAARVARTVYHGPYEGLGAAWGEFKDWIAAHGHVARADLWECYVAGPEANADPSTWRTELNQPLV